jgi:hypothetical protein
MFLEGMFLVMLGIVVTSFAAFVRQVNSFKKKPNRILPVDKFDLQTHPLREIVEHSSETETRRSEKLEAYEARLSGEGNSRGVALRKTPRETKHNIISA